MKTKCIELRVWKDCKLLSVTRYPMTSSKNHASPLHASLEIARRAKVNFEQHILCDDSTGIHTELGFGEVTG